MEKSSSQNWVTPNDLDRSATVHHLPDVYQAIRPLADSRVTSILDIGCGFGGLAKILAERFTAQEVHGIDIDDTALDEAKEKGIITHHLDVGSHPLPFSDGYFDLITCFGMMDYLPVFDHPIKETFRVLGEGGHILISLPNLASWHNRLMLLMGYQLRDVEVSEETLCGVHRRYRGQTPTGHIHTVTPKAFAELMGHHGFETVAISRGRPKTKPIGAALELLDSLLSFTPSLSRRFFYLGRKPVL